MATTSRITLSLPRTQRFARSHCLVALLAVVSGLLVLATLREPLIIYDEGIVVVGAWRVMHGDIPYRDFWTIYAPGQFYLLAALFRLVGPSLLAERLVDRAIRVLIVVLVYRFVARLTSPLVALAPSLIVTL